MDNEQKTTGTENNDAAILESLQKTLADMENQLSDLTAERDSLLSELDELKTKHTAIGEELKKTKELNFTLARQTSHAETASSESMLHDIFGKAK